MNLQFEESSAELVLRLSLQMMNEDLSVRKAVSEFVLLNQKSGRRSRCFSGCLL
jgi:hypothetical protein